VTFRGFLVAIAALCCGYAGDVRQADWGMTEEQVRATEASAPIGMWEVGAATFLQYDAVAVGKLKCSVVYLFTAGKLTRAIQTFSAKHDDPNEFIADFRQAEPVLVESLGKPTRDQALWQNEEFQDEPTSYLDQDRAASSSILPTDRYVGKEVEFGHLKLYTQWIRPRTRVLHSLTGKDGRVIHQIEYRSADAK
jgi:hypothetical protein